MNRNRLNGSMHTSHPTMATLVNRAAPWWVNHWEGLFCKDELWLFNCCYHRNIQYSVISELCGTFICKILFPNNMKNLTKALSQIFFAIVSARSINHSFHERDLWGLFGSDMFACSIETIMISKTFFVKTHMREERQLGTAQLAWWSIISARPF